MTIPSSALRRYKTGCSKTLISRGESTLLSQKRFLNVLFVWMSGSLVEPRLPSGVKLRVSAPAVSCCSVLSLRGQFLSVDKNKTGTISLENHIDAIKGGHLRKLFQKFSLLWLSESDFRTSAKFIVCAREPDPSLRQID